MTNTDIRLKGVVAEDFCNYKLPSMFLVTTICDWKCCHEGGFSESVCQNNDIVKQPTKAYSLQSVYDLYINNDITKAIVIGGLEPFKQFNEIYNLIEFFRNNGCNDPFIIYTGYYPNELSSELELLKQHKNIIIKYGRYVPNNTPHYDDVLGINLASDNQYAEVLS